MGQKAEFPAISVSPAPTFQINLQEVKAEKHSNSLVLRKLFYFSGICFSLRQIPGFDSGTLPAKVGE